MHALSRRQLTVLIALTLVWGFNWPIMKLGVTGYPPLIFRTLCMVLGLPVLGAVRGKVGDLRLERNHQIGCGVNDGGAEIVDLVGVALEPPGKLRGFGVQADTKHGTVVVPGGAQHVEKGHRHDFTVAPTIDRCTHSPDASSPS